MFFECLLKFTCEATYPGRFFVASILITTLILLVKTGLFRVSVSSGFSFARLCVSMNLSISLVCPICSHIVTHNIVL